MREFLPLIMLLVFLGTACEKETDLREIENDSYWEVSDPSLQGMDKEALDSLGQIVKEFEHIYSFLVIRNGKIVYEQYSNGANGNTLLHVRSVTKRITATLAGIAIDHAYIDSIEVPVTNYFPEYSQLNADPDWQQVSVRNLLNMTSGMDWNEEEELNQYEQNLSQPLIFIFSRDILYAPDTYYAYNSPGFLLVSYIIDRTTDISSEAFVNNYLFEPLGINGYEWEKDGNDKFRGGAGLELTARDLAKIGYLYLQDGLWEEERVLSESFVRQCFSESLLLDTIQGNHMPGLSVSNSWWNIDFGGYTLYYGDGYGGQILLLIPEEDIAVVMNRYHRVEPDENRRAFNEVFDIVIPQIIGSIE
jgi:CubicO group peptidase (beta-lactamase class C family)